MARDFPRYRAHCASSFIPKHGQSPEQWSSERAQRLGQPDEIRIDLSDAKLETVDAGHVVAEFTQAFASQGYRDEVTKRMDWVRESERWKIQREQILAIQKVSVPQLVNPRPKAKRPQLARTDCKCD